MRNLASGKVDTALREASRANLAYDRKNPYWAWRFRILQAHILFMRASNKEALLLLRDEPPQALANTDIVLRQKLVQGLAYQALQDRDNAQKSLDDTVRLSGSSYPDILGPALIARGTLDIDESNYEEGEADFHRALAIARQRKQPTLEATALGNLGLVAMKEEHYDESIDWDRQAIQFSQSTGQQVSLPPILGNLGWSYFEMGDLDNALSYYKQAEAAASQAGLIGDRVLLLSDVGNVYYEQHDLTSAESTMQQALELARKGDSRSAVTQCLNDIAQVALETGRIPLAQKYVDEALNNETQGEDPAGVLYSNMIEGRIETAKHDFTKAEQFLRKVIDDPRAETSLRWEAEARLAKAYTDAGALPEADAEYRLAIRTIEIARSTVKSEDFRLSFLTSAISFYSDYIDFLVSRGRVQDALGVAELSRARTVADGLGVSSASLSFPIRGFQPTATARKLNGIVLSYWLGADRSYLWLVTPKKVRIVPLPPAKEIDSIVHSYREALTGPRDVLETANAAGLRLYDLLVAPAANQIPIGSRVIVIPDGSLYQLNFEALLVARPLLHYWIEDVTVAKANSLILLTRPSRSAVQRENRLLLIGDPVPANGDFPRLRQAETEMKQIAGYFPASERVVISGASATPQAYLDSRPGDFSLLHFVTHGIASRESPLDSAIILTRQGDSYKLYARDIVKLPLRANLVVISACHGTGERFYAGEGLVGLMWAFLHAGAREVISALWEADDNSTAHLMNQLYAGISKGVPPDSALRNAKLDLLHSGSVYKRPFYWAPFEIFIRL